MFRFNRVKMNKLIGVLAVAAAVAGSCAILAVEAAPARATDAADAAKYDCDRACLQQISDSYFDALAQHNPAAAPFAPDARYSETGSVTKIGEGLWRQAGKPTYRMEIFDPETGGIGIDAVVPDGGVPTIVALRLKVENHKITEAESILVRGDDPAGLHSRAAASEHPAF